MATNWNEFTPVDPSVKKVSVNWDEFEPVEDKPSGFLDTIKSVGTAVYDDVTGGLERRKKKEQQESFDRSNAAMRLDRERQMTGGTPDELQRRAESDAARRAYDESGAQVVEDAAGLTRDTGVNLVRGVGAIGKSATGLTAMPLDAIGALDPLKKVGVDFRGAQQGFNEFDKWAASYLTERGKKSEADVEATQGFTETLAQLGSDPRGLFAEITKSLPGTVLAGKVGEAAVGVYGTQFAKEAAAKGLSGPLAQKYIAEQFAANADKITKVALLGAAAGEGAQSTGDIAGTAQAAGREFKNYALPAVAAGIGTAAINVGAGKLANKMGIGDLEQDIALRKTGIQAGKTGAAGPVERAAVEGFKEGVLEEMPQSGQEAAMENIAMGRPWDQGVGKAMARGLATGAGMGGGHALVSLPGDPPQPVRAGASAVPPAASAADVLGAPQGSQASAGLPAGTAGGSRPAPAFAQSTAGEQALFEPKSLTALDRVTEIDAKLPTAAPEEAAALQAEREGITKTWPKAAAGAPTSFSTETGARLDAQYALMEAGDLTTSHDENLRPSPLYPQELQPRDRDRAASEMQVSGIVQRLDPARLGESADAATGAPIVGADGLVESGNARTIALKRVYRANGLKADSYKQFLRDNAARLGIAPESVDAMQNPVLVRVRSTPVNRAEFARQANASTVAQMSPSEQARSDANRIDDMGDLTPDDNGDFTGGDSRGFVRRFMAKLPGTEQAGMIDATGNLSQSGYARIRNAVLAKAYGDSPVLMRMVESMDDNLRNITKALMRVAPQVAKTRQAIEAGALFDADITPDLMAAVSELSRLKDEGRSVGDALAQSGMFGDYSPEVRDMLAFLNENIRRPKQIAEFIQRYFEALEAAGNPNQGSIFGEATAPAKADLLALARRINDVTEDTERRDAGQDQGPGAEGRGQSQDAQGGVGGAQGDEAQTEWVAFPADSETLGIPRAEMPQVKGEHRGALVQFLKARGIENQTVDIPALDLKPTQAEFSIKKAARWAGVSESVDRSVLVSSDGYILDGHHQWVAALAAGEPVKAIQFSAPIRPLMDAVYAFPSVTRSEGATTADPKTKAREDFKDALAELGTLFRQLNPGVRMFNPEERAKILPVMVRVMETGIRAGTFALKDLVAQVKKVMREHADEFIRKHWNKVDNAFYSEASRIALDREQNGVTAKNYIREIDNFTAPHIRDFLPPGVVAEAEENVRKYFTDKADPVISPEDKARAEELLKPLIKQAEDAKVEYDQKVMDIAKRSGAIGQMLAPIKGMKRAVPKLVIEENFNVAGMKDMLRSTIVVDSYADVQAVLTEIEKEFTLLRDPKNRTGGAPVVSRGKTIEAEDPAKYGGYSDVMVNIVMPNGVIAEIQINVPEMLGAKEGPDFKAPGHKLYEAYRDAPKESPLGREILGKMLGYYAAARDASLRSDRTSFRKSSSDLSYHSDTGPRGPILGRGSNDAPSSDSANQAPSGNSTKKPPSTRSPNLQPFGKDSGTDLFSDISSTSTDIVARQGSLDYNGYVNRVRGNGDDNAGSGSGGAQGEKSGAAQKPRGKRGTEGIPEGKSGLDLFGGREPDAAGPGAEQVGQPGAGRVRGEDENGRGAKPRSRAGRPAGIPAGRDIPAKSGRNYAFGDADLTYEGSWFKKATQNVEAVELVKKLEAEGRQATREEQAVLAKFIGWGASEIANSVFGDKLDKQLAAISNYESAIGWLDEYNRAFLQRGQGRHWDAFQVLLAKTPGLEYWKVDRITREDLEAAKPDLGVRRWADLRDRLKAVMSKDEWQSASRSTQNAHYTSKPIVQSMMRMISRMGFAGGTVLEPGAGIGVFPGLMPVGMATNSVYTGVEMDPITGGILKQLFPDERILVESFVDSKLPAGYYDVAFGNPPFADIPILADPKYKKFAFLLHDYFFAKTIDSVKPGGLVVFVTSNGTMDKRGDKARAYMAERADLVGAVRLPQTAFKKNAGTEVVTDVLILRKKVEGETFEHGQEWLKSVPIKVGDKDFTINEYFVNHPDMVLGTHSSQGSMYAKDSYTVLPKEGDIDALFDAAAASLPADIYRAERGSGGEAAKVREIDFNPKAKKEGNYYVTDAGALMVREGGVGLRVDGKSEKDIALLKDFVTLRDALKQAHYDQLNNGEWEPSLAALQKAYAEFVKTNGQVNQFTTYMQRVKVDVLDEEGVPTGDKEWDEEERNRYPLLSKIQDDPDWTLVAALESINHDTGEISKSAFLTDRVLGKPAPVDAKTPPDALLQVLNETGVVSIPAIAERIGLSEQETIDSLGALIYDDPENGWVTADEYLSGDVRKKLRAAQAAAKTDRKLERNVEALIAALPTPKTHSEITPQIGMSWIPTATYEQFLREKADIDLTVSFNERTGQWHVAVDDSSYTKSIADRGSKRKGSLSDAATKDWGTDRRSAADILEYALTGSPVRIMSKQGTGKDEKEVFDPVATEAVTEKLNKMREAFKSWLWEDAARVDQLVPLYNEKFNSIVPRKFDGAHMTLPGTSKKWSVFDHVKRGAWRIVQAGNTYLAHAVGSGKTFQMIISAMEQKRLGLVKKPMMVVPNHMLQQFAREWQDLYPAARLMVADEANFTGDNRRRFVSRVAMSDLDGVIITHSAFKLLDLDPKFKEKVIEQELDFLRAAYKELGEDPDRLTFKESTNKKGEITLKVEGSGSRDPKVKQIEKKIERMEQKLRAALSSEGKDQNVRFDETGVDMLYVDEAHEFRKLSFTTARQVKGIDSNGSDRAFDLHMKVQWLRENKNPKRNLVMASGTPVTNTLAEIYSVQKFMAPDVLAERGLEEFDQWASMFGAESTNIEPDASGKYGPVTRFNKFVNVGELTQMFREFADVLTSDYLASLLGDKRPKVKGGSRSMMITPKTETYARFQKEDLQPRMEASRAWKPSRDEPNNPDPIIRIIGDGRLAAIDMRFMEPSLPSDPGSKLNRMIDEVIRVYKETADWQYKEKDTDKFEPNKGAAQIVFSDLGFGEGVAENRGFNARAWFEKRLRDAGVAPAHVAFMSDNKKSTAKIKLFRDINAGRVRIVVGSSKNMGTGVNAQQRLIALHHLDSPWYPADLEQREGRIVRQGNKNPEVQLYAYAAKGSYDEQMWSTLARKQFFIDQALSGDPNIREIEDLGESSQFEIAAAMVADDPRVLQLAGLRAEVEKLSRLYQAHEDARGRSMKDFETAKMRQTWAEKSLPAADAEAARVKDLSGSNFVAQAGGKSYDSRKEWGDAILTGFKDLIDRFVEQDTVIGSMSGFDVVARAAKHQDRVKSFSDAVPRLYVRASENVALSESPAADPVGIALRAYGGLVALSRRPAELRQLIEESKAKQVALVPRLNAEFPLKQMLLDKEAEARGIEAAIVSSGKEDPGLAREQELEDAWQERTGAITPLFSRSATGGGMSLRDLKAVRDRVAARMRNLPAVHVFESPSDPGVPKALRDHIVKAGAVADVEGAMHEGEIYLFASNLADEERAERVLAEHEVTHYGLRAVFGPALDRILLSIWNNNPKVRSRAAGLKVRNKLASNVEATEEVLADMAPGDLVKLKGWRRLVATVRDWFDAHGFEKMAKRLNDWLGGKLSEQERADLLVADVVTKARAWVQSGGPAGGVLAGSRLSRSAMKSVSANIDRGLKALADSITGKTTVHRAMFRTGLGWVDFVWGDTGIVLPSGRSKGAKGLSHIVEARMRKDGLTEQQAIGVLNEMVRTIAAGEEFDRKVFANVIRVGLRHDGYIAWLAKQPGGNAWIVTGYEIDPDRSASGRASADPTTSDASRTRDGEGAGSESNVPRLSRAGQAPTAAERADQIIEKQAGTWRPVDAVMRGITKATRFDTLTGRLYDGAAHLLDRYTPESIKAGVVSDYGVPEAVIDRRVAMQGAMKQQIRGVGTLLERLATLTRAESRLAYEWMNNNDPQAAKFFEEQLPAESLNTMREVKALIDQLSQEAVRLGQLSPDAFERNRFEYLHRSYAKHMAELTKSETAGRKRATAILGDQYKGRGMTDAVDMAKFKAVAPEWWNRKLQAGKADKQLKGEKFIRLERRAPVEGAGVAPLEDLQGPNQPATKKRTKLLEVAYWPAGEKIPAKYSEWDEAGTWEVRDTKGNSLVVWRDFTKAERTTMGEIDEARYAIAKTLHGMIHDIETGRYLQWVGDTYAKKAGEAIDGEVIEASERMRDVFAPGTWVQVPDTKVPGTQVKKYGALAGKFIPGPIWNDVRQTVGFRLKPFGETYAAILSAWKTAKTALSPAVHTNNVMANMVMADWHDVTAGHMLKSLRLILAASQRDGKGLIGRTGNLAARAGLADREAAREIINRFQDSGGNLGSWVVAELQNEQLEPLLAAMEKEIATAGETAGGQIGVFVALQKALQVKFPEAWDAFKASKPAQMVKTEAGSLIDLYEAEDQVFRLAAWLRAKEEGASDLQAGKVARRSFLDYHINAPWIQAMRGTIFPFVSFTYRSVPMLLEVAARKPHKLMKLAMFAGGLNALAYAMLGGGGDEDEERKLLPEEKAGKIWGLVPKLIRMPWNDKHQQPVFLDIRRFVPVGDVFDTGSNHAALPLIPAMIPGGPAALLVEVLWNKQQFTGKEITNRDIDTLGEQAAKAADYLYKAFAPNIVILPGTHAWTAVANAGKGKTDTFGRELSTAQAMASTVGIKLGSYPKDVLTYNAVKETQAKMMDVDAAINKLKREYSRKGIDQAEFEEKVKEQAGKKKKLADDLQRRVAGR